MNADSIKYKEQVQLQDCFDILLDISLKICFAGAWRVCDVRFLCTYHVLIIEFGLSTGSSLGRMQPIS